ncbi:hypothetical protein MNBD_GAMMA15-280 [hydrothermal vent metagenome]|uniref:Ice-binding protein C-terminal domain-containing protein n=1 Tax=hydrothermal vent metagenome TaxID=652676 RepID=A0A3B0YQ18_9ZZZZ
MRIHNIIRSTVAALTIGISQSSIAAPIDILQLGLEDSGPFQYSGFHVADANYGMSGAMLAWFAIGRGDSGFWDPDTGAFSLSVHLFDDSGLSTNAGTATATGNLSEAAFNGFDGGLIGSITWDFTNATNAVLNNLGTSTISLIDINYATSTNGYTANSTNTNSMTLWGAEGEYDAMTGLFDTQTTTIGMDLVALFNADIKPVPVPAAVWLFGSGLIGLVAVARRRKIA